MCVSYSEASSDMAMLLRDVDCPYNSNPGDALQHILRCKCEHVPSGLTVDHSLDLAVECSEWETSYNEEGEGCGYSCY